MVGGTGGGGRGNLKWNGRENSVWESCRSGFKFSVMNEAPKKIWFAAKTYGLGWGLALCWQGWLVYFIYVVLLFGGIAEILVGRKANPGFFVLYTIGVSLGLCFVCWLKGEKLAWRWGGK